MAWEKRLVLAIGELRLVGWVWTKGQVCEIRWGFGLFLLEWEGLELWIGRRELEGHRKIRERL